MRDKKSIQKELGEIYDNNFKLLRSKFSQALRANPKLNLILRLLVVANIGIWLSVAMLILELV